MNLQLSLRKAGYYVRTVLRRKVERKKGRRRIVFEKQSLLRN